MAFPVLSHEGVRPAFASLFHAGHQGTDIFAPRGAPVVACVDGSIRHAVEAKGGRAVYLTTVDGTQYYYAHLEGFAGERLGPGQSRAVRAGELLGWVGDSGNASGKAPHVHFEVRPFGGSKVDPAPLLSRAGWGPAPASPLAPRASDGLDPLAVVLLAVMWGMSR